MQTYRLWLEADKEIPRFKRLRFAKAEVPIGDVLRKGIHPWQGDQMCPSLKDKVLEVLNAEDMKPAEFEKQGYCCELSRPGENDYYNYNDHSCKFEKTLKSIAEHVCFVEALTYQDLLSIAWERIRRLWSRRLAHTFLNSAQPGFEAMRAFLKKKNPEVKISSYADFDCYPLDQILKPEDFAQEDTIVIREGIPDTNFRSSAFIERVADERGFLRLTTGIRHFQLTCTCGGPNFAGSVDYNCERSGETIRFRPILSRNGSREAAKEFARRWRMGAGRYCFAADIERLDRMVQQDQCVLTFPSLRYDGPREAGVSHADVAAYKTPRFALGHYFTSSDSGETLRRALQHNGVSMTGRKEELVDKLARLAAKTYEKVKPRLDDYFAKRRFIRVERGSEGQHFPLLEGYDIRHLLLTMYVMKHLRGNVILEASHENDTYDSYSIARALVSRQVSLKGAFLLVE